MQTKLIPLFGLAALVAAMLILVALAPDCSGSHRRGIAIGDAMQVSGCETDTIGSADVTTPKAANIDRVPSMYRVGR